MVEDRVKLPNGKDIEYLRFAEGGNGVTVICLRDDKILLQEEYSYPVDGVLCQFPGGKIGVKETVEEAAVRELKEESGLKAKKIKQLGWYYPNNRRTDSKMHVVLTEDFIKKETRMDEEEDIQSRWVSVEKLEKMIKSNLINNYSVLAAWALFREKHSSKS